MDAKEWIRDAVTIGGGPREPTDADDTAGYLARDDASGVVVREATGSDAPTLAAIGSRAFHHAHSAVLHPVDLAGVAASRFDAADIRRDLAEADSLWLVALWAGQAVGFAQLRTATLPTNLPGRLPIELRGLFVAPDWSRHGVGSTLVEACSKLALSLGHESLWVRVFAANRTAVSFLQHQQFERVHRDLLIGRKSSATVLTLSRSLVGATD